jgi:hypothetical protein
VQLKKELQSIKDKISDYGKLKMFMCPQYREFFADLVSMHPDLTVSEDCFLHSGGIECALTITTVNVKIRKNHVLSGRLLGTTTEQARSSFALMRKEVRRDIMLHGIANVENAQREIERKRVVHAVEMQKEMANKQLEEYAKDFEEKLWFGASGSPGKDLSRRADNNIRAGMCAHADALRGIGGEQMFFDEASNIKPGFDQRYIMSHDPAYGPDHNGILWVDGDKVSHITGRTIKEVKASSRVTWNNPLRSPNPYHTLLGDTPSSLSAFYNFKGPLEYSLEDMLKWSQNQWETQKAKGMLLPAGNVQLARFGSEEKLAYSIARRVLNKKLLL